MPAEGTEETELLHDLRNACTINIMKVFTTPWSRTEGQSPYPQGRRVPPARWPHRLSTSACTRARTPPSKRPHGAPKHTAGRCNREHISRHTKCDTRLRTKTALSPVPGAFAAPYFRTFTDKRSACWGWGEKGNLKSHTKHKSKTHVRKRTCLTRALVMVMV